MVLRRARRDHGGRRCRSSSLLFIPIVIGMKHLYSGSIRPLTCARDAASPRSTRRPCLNVSFFIVRSVHLPRLFALRRLAALRLVDAAGRDGRHELTVASAALSAGGLPFVALVMAFAAFDWLMSLNPTWFSTMFGVYFFAGSFLGAVAAGDRHRLARRQEPLRRLRQRRAPHNIGKLMLAFTCFWAYIGFSQFLLIWIAGLPEETPFYIMRFKPAGRRSASSSSSATSSCRSSRCCRAR